MGNGDIDLGIVPGNPHGSNRLIIKTHPLIPSQGDESGLRSGSSLIRVAEHQGLVGREVQKENILRLSECPKGLLGITHQFIL